MKIFTVNERSIQQLEADTPLDASIALQEDQLQRQKRLLQSSKDLSLQLRRLHDEYKEEILYLVGKERFDKYIGQYAELLARFAAVPGSFSRTRDGSRSEEEARKHLKAEKHRLYHAMGFDTSRAIVLRKRYLQRAREALDSSLEPDAQIPADASTVAPEPTSNPWTWVFPPYVHGWTSIQESNGSRGVRQRTLSATPTSGEINLWSRNELYGADDSDWSRIDIMSEVGFWFRMPAAGLVEAWIRYQDVNTDYTGQLGDESGCSDADIQQLSRVYLWTSGSTERYSTVVDYHRGEREGSWAVGGATGPGATLSRQFFSNRTYAAGEWVYVAAGARDLNYFWVDDMWCRSVMQTRWFVNHVVVRSTGAP